MSKIYEMRPAVSASIASRMTVTAAALRFVRVCVNSSGENRQCRNWVLPSYSGILSALTVGIGVGAGVVSVDMVVRLNGAYSLKGQWERQT